MFDPSKVETIETEAGPIKVRPPKGSDRLLAGQLAQDAPNLITVFEALLCVVEVGGNPQPRPTTRNKLDALADRLGIEAMDAVMGWYNKIIFPEFDEIRQELGPGATADEIGERMREKRTLKTKNSHGTP